MAAKTTQTEKRDQREPRSYRSQVESDVQSTSRFSREMIKTIVFNVVNFIVVGILIFILTRLPGMAENLKQLRSEDLLKRETDDVAVLKSDIERATERVETLDSFFVENNGLVELVTEINRIRSNGVLTDFTFLGNNAISDRSGYSAVPISMTFSGSIDQINQTLREIESLPYYVKGIDIELERVSNEEGGTSFELRYGGIIYVGEDI